MDTVGLHVYIQGCVVGAVFRTESNRKVAANFGLIVGSPWQVTSKKVNTAIDDSRTVAKIALIFVLLLLFSPVLKRKRLLFT